MSRKEHPFFLPYQRRWIEDRSRLKVMEKSRQVGISWATAYAAVRRQARLGERLDCWVSSRDELQAKLFLEDCKAFADVLDLAARDMGRRVVDGETRASAFVLQFANGRRLHSLSSNADAQAGKRGGRILDEFALHPDPRRLYAVAYPGITWGGRLEIISTHRGSGNFFSRLVDEVRHKGNPKGFSLHRVTLDDALEEGFLERLQAKLPDDDERKGMTRDGYREFIRAGCADEESWRQEYLCEPADDVSAFLSCDLIASCEYADGEDWERRGDFYKGRKEALLYAGVDVGRERDLTVVWVLERVGGVLFTRRVECLERTPFARQEEVLYEWLELAQMRRVCIDQSGLGRQFAERAAERFGRYRVEGLTLTGPEKESLAYPARAAFEGRGVRIPGGKRVRADLRSLRRELTAGGHVRLAAERGPQGHGDRFWALALALHAARQPRGSGGAERVPRRISRRASRGSREILV